MPSNDRFPPTHGPNRWVSTPSPDDRETVHLTNNPSGLAATMSERAAAGGHDTATIHAESLLRGEAGRWNVLALSVVVLGLLIAAPVAYSVMTPTGSAPAATPSALPAIEVAPLLTAAPSPSATATPAPGPAGPQGPAGVTTVIYVPVSSASSGSGSSATSSRPRVTTKPKPKPTTDPYARYDHGSACGTQTERWSSGHAYASFGRGVYEVPFSCPDWKYGMGTRTSTPNGTVVNPPAK